MIKKELVGNNIYIDDGEGNRVVVSVIGNGVLPNFLFDDDLEIDKLIKKVKKPKVDK